MTFGFAVLREVVIKGLLFGIVGSITGGIAPLLDVLWPLWDEENRALHDFVVDTRVGARGLSSGDCGRRRGGRRRWRGPPRSR